MARENGGVEVGDRYLLDGDLVLRRCLGLLHFPIKREMSSGC